MTIINKHDIEQNLKMLQQHLTSIQNLVNDTHLLLNQTEVVKEDWECFNKYVKPVTNITEYVVVVEDKDVNFEVIFPLQEEALFYANAWYEEMHRLKEYKLVTRPLSGRPHYTVIYEYE